jgi:hypothetical protein
MGVKYFRQYKADVQDMMGGELTNPPWDGVGQYESFPNLSGGSTGGGGYTPPVAPNPTFIPPSYTSSDAGTLKIYLSSTENSQFERDGSNIGIGLSTVDTFSPASTFGSSRTYRAVSNNKIPENYFTISVSKKYSYTADLKFDDLNLNINPYSSMFGGMGGKSGFSGLSEYGTYNNSFNYNYIPSLTTNDVLFTEVISIQEFILNDDGTYNSSERRLDSTSGTINLEFKFKEIEILNNLPALPLIPEVVINYEIGFSSNFKNELGDILKLNYEILSNSDENVDSGVISLADGNTNNKSINKSVLENSYINLSIVGDLSTAYLYKNIYYAPLTIAQNSPDGDYSKWNLVGKSFKLTGKELSSGIVVVAILEKEINVAAPVIMVSETQYNIQVKDSDLEKEVRIAFRTENADEVIAYTSTDKYILTEASVGYVTLYFQKDFNEVYGTKKVILTPTSKLYGTGKRVEILVTFTAINDYPSITQVLFPEVIDVPSFSDLQIEWEIEYNTFATSFVDVFLLAKDKTRIGLAEKLPANGSFKINLRTLAEKYPTWNGNDNVSLYLIPKNNGGAESLVGNEYEVVTQIFYPSVYLDENSIKKSIYDAFINKLSFIEPEKDSKYLTHLANFGNDEQILVSSYEEDNWTLSSKKKDELGNEIVDKEVKSVILKLYSPIPANINENSTFWITKLMTNPLIETIILNEQDSLKCPPIKGPNFDIEVDFTTGKSTTYESLDNLILSSSTSANSLVTTYLSSSLSYQSDLNIDYASGSNPLEGYLWDNFVHFSSATERLDNFVYKVQLIEKYEQLITSASTNYTGGPSGSYINELVSKQEVEKQIIKKNQILQGFDGFETFLYTSSSLSWPHDISGNRLYHTNTNVTNWYASASVAAETFDLENPNWVMNNIPTFINDIENSESFHLLLNMLAHHFDVIYYYTKAIENGRGLGYKSKNGVPDKLLFDVLKSFNWDAKNLADDAKLWEYVFGVDSEGTTKNTSPAKQRTFEIWRRIANNLPYLLKHKGTRRGIYALLSCYGIPSSNLSILEFGGPEVTDVSKSKLVMDNITTALNMISGSYIEFEWKNTERNRKPDTIEFFVKPYTSGNYNIISGSGGMILNLSGSTDSNYGVVTLNYSGSAISSSLLPIFNNRFFGIGVSREVSGSYHNFELNIRQSDKERTIFQQSYSSSILSTSSNWNDGSYIRLGNNFTGSIDEFRLWSVPLQKERFYEHVSFPEMINGNHISSSTDDLYFRLDFEYPKNLNETFGTSSLINVDTNMYFSSSLTRNNYEDGNLQPIYSLNPSASFTASAYGFTSITSYPYQFEPIDRSVVLEIPDVGSTRYSTNKVRFESQTDFVGNDVSGGVDLSSKHRATKKAFDQSPTDSNRVGLFFSPTKELNIDIAKSLGGVNLDNYIGDPSDRYKSNYKRLDDLRNYYFQRFDGRDIYAYINLIKLYEKSMFEDIKKMLPARVKATTGLLIEPHILERSKVSYKKPVAEDYQKDVTIHFSDTTTLTADNDQLEVIIDSNLGENLSGENEQFETLITDTTIDQITANNYQYDSLINTNDNFVLTSDEYQQYTTIDAGLGEPTILTEIDLINSNIVVGQTDYETIGFGIYSQSGSAIRTYYDVNRNVVKERIRVNLVTEQKSRDVVAYKVVTPEGKGDPRGGYYLTSSVYTEMKLNIQPFSGSTSPVVSGNIIDVKPVSGYLPTHFKNTSDLTRGLENSFFKGSKNTAATTLDGSSPIETFTTNPNTLKVSKAGRDINEPILEVE